MTKPEHVTDLMNHSPARSLHPNFLSLSLWKAFLVYLWMSVERKNATTDIHIGEAVHKVWLFSQVQVYIGNGKNAEGICNPIFLQRTANFCGIQLEIAHVFSSLYAVCGNEVFWKIFFATNFPFAYLSLILEPGLTILTLIPVKNASQYALNLAPFSVAIDPSIKNKYIVLPLSGLCQLISGPPYLYVLTSYPLSFFVSSQSLELKTIFGKKRSSAWQIRYCSTGSVTEKFRFVLSNAFKRFCSVV